MKKILVLGAGLVAKPLVEYLMKQDKITVTVASRTVSKAEALVGNNPDGKALSLNVKNENALEELVSSHDLSVSLLPYTYHLTVAKLCLKHGKNLVTTSYVKKEMMDLDAEVTKKGLLFINEIGLDPGIDHMSAMKIIHHVRENGGTIASFRSYCGGLPAFEANNVPFGYKFSWSPKGVILAARNPARYMIDGEIVEVASEKLFDDYHLLDVPEFGTFEAYPNRDSLPYIDLYGFKAIKTMYRGTLRNISHCETWRLMAELGMFDDDTPYDPQYKTLAEVFQHQILKTDRTDLEAVVREKLDLKVANVLNRKLRWLGLFSDQKIDLKEGSLVDLLTEQMLRKLSYMPGERDLVILHHDFIAEYPAKKEHITSTLIDHGIPHGDSSMSRTVALPAAVVAALIVKGKIPLTGVKIPVEKEVYTPVMKELETLGVSFKEVFTTL